VQSKTLSRSILRRKNLKVRRPGKGIGRRGSQKKKKKSPLASEFLRREQWSHLMSSNGKEDGLLEEGETNRCRGDVIALAVNHND